MAIKLKDWKLAGIVLSLALLVLAFWKVDFPKLLSVLGGANLLLVVAVAFINFAVVAMKALRWQVVLAPTKRITFSTVFLTTLIGFMANNCLPARAGELVRIVALGKKENISKTTVLGTLTLDRVFEGLGMLVVLVALPFMIEMPSWMKQGALVFVVVLLLALGLLLLLMREQTARWVTYLPLSRRWAAFFGDLATKLRAGLKTLTNFGTVANVLAISLIIWFTQALMVILCLESIGLHFRLNHAFFILLAINIALLIPAAPGNLGTFELSAALALGALGVGNAQALSFALIYHLVQFIPITLAGVLVLPLLGMGVRDIGHDNQLT